MTKYLMVICCVYSAVQLSHAACPRINNNEVPIGNSSAPVVKRVNTRNTRRNTIFFCKEPRPASHTVLTFSELDFIGNVSGTDSVRLENASTAVPIGTGSVILSNSTTIPEYQLLEQNTRILATQPRMWGERTLFHFYRRIRWYETCSWGIHRGIRNYLRRNPYVFYISNNPAPTTDTTNTWSIAKLDDAVLTNANGTKVKADIAFYWLQNKNRGGGRGTGGNWTSGGYRFCHFAVAVEFKLKTNYHGTAYNISEAGDYNVRVGVWTEN